MRGSLPMARHARCCRGITSAGLVLLIGISPGTASAQESQPQAGGRTQTTVAGANYAAGAFKKLAFGNAYRDIWTLPIEVEVLDLAGEAGGLDPVRRVGGLQTAGLALRGADGRSYTFRAVAKDPTLILPEELQNTPIADIAQDQISASFPAGSLIAAPLARAAGVLQPLPRLVIMPDDSRLGEFREEFAGLLGTIEEFPTAAADTFGATEIIGGREIFDHLTSSSAVVVDAEAFLRARLVDLLIGDWDRHVEQWRWARIPGTARLQPIAEDRDQAFSRYEGIALAMARDREPKFDSFQSSYQGLEGLTWNARSLDRRLLSGLGWPAWERAAREVQTQLTDAVIGAAARRMPAEYYELHGAELIARLRARRDGLSDEARRFYLYLSKLVNIYATNSADAITIERQGGSVSVSVAPGGGACDAPTTTGEPFFTRRFEPAETDQLRIYTGGGDDRVAVSGRPSGDISIVVIGGAGNNLLCDSAASRQVSFDLSSQGKGGGGISIADGLRIAPSEPIEATGTPEEGQGAAADARRDWGSTSYRTPWFGYGPDLGAFIGSGIAIESFGFRKRPYGSRHQIRLGFSTGALRPRLDYDAEFRPENRRYYWSVRALVSGIETLNFYGLGNETPNVEAAELRRVQQAAALVETRLVLRLGENASFSTGPVARYTSTDLNDDRVISRQRPYGVDNIGQVGWVAGLSINTRRLPGTRSVDATDDTLRWGPAPVGPGYTLDVDATHYPRFGDLVDEYTVIRGAATASYWLPGQGLGVGFRVGGQQNFGAFPYYDAAFIGGSTIRGLRANRFAGESSAYGNVELLARVGRLSLVLPGRWGIFVRADGGRVWLDGEDSDTWHTGIGGGLWWAPWNLTNAIRLYGAKSDEQTALYLLLGFGF